MYDNPSTETTWCENIIIADADYLDYVAFDLIVNFERIIGRRIPQADMARWIDCMALDGGLREGNNKTQVILTHSKKHRSIANFIPGNYEEELNGKAFKDHLGEFNIMSLPVEEMVEPGEFFTEIVKTVCNSKEVKRVMIVPDTRNENLYHDVRHALSRIDDEEKRITVFTMEPMQGGNYRQEILGYSLMNALGIKADEIKE